MTITCRMSVDAEGLMDKYYRNQKEVVISFVVLSSVLAVLPTFLYVPMIQARK